jgi:hypothetical protein
MGPTALSLFSMNFNVTFSDAGGSAGFGDVGRSCCENAVPREKSTDKISRQSLLVTTSILNLIFATTQIMFSVPNPISTGRNFTFSRAD